MKTLTRACYVSFLTSSLMAFAVATVGGQYSVNVHFVPPLVTASCQVAQFWSPPNVTCALCFCMTGTLSRCIPQPGCNPQAQNTTSTTPSSTGSSPPPTEAENPEPHPPAAEEENSTASNSNDIDPAPPAPAPTEPSSSGSSNKLRAAKPGKSRRRRRSSRFSSKNA